MDYGFTHEGRVYTPNGTPVSLEENEARNAAIEAAELAHWQSKPDRFIAYVSKSNLATTWTGKVLGRIYERCTYRNNFGHNETYVRVQGNNGASYYGRYGSDWSQSVRLRKYK